MENFVELGANDSSRQQQQQSLGSSSNGIPYHGPNSWLGIGNYNSNQSIKNNNNNDYEVIEMKESYNDGTLNRKPNVYHIAVPSHHTSLVVCLFVCLFVCYIL